MINFDSDTRTPEETDRIFVSACAGIWGVWLIISAVTAVALVNLGRGHRSTEGSPWLLYAVIAISAIVVIGAIPLLLKARRVAAQSRGSGSNEPVSVTAAENVAPARPALQVTEAPTEKMRVFGASIDPRAIDPRAGRHSRPDETATDDAGVTDRLWLRGTTSLLGAMGLALIAVSTATYLLASGTGVGAWIALGLAGLFTAAMPAMLIAFQRQLDEPANEHPAD